VNLIAAQAYADRHGPHALLVERDGEIVVEAYAGGYDPAKPHALYSGTKSFWGVAAVAAQHDGLLHLDERVAETFASWASGSKALVTLRHVLQLTSGIGFGGLGASVPPYEKALATALKDEPGARFTYGGIPLQVFGAVLARKLEPRALTPHEYLRRRVLDPAGARIGWWRTLADGTHPLPTGAALTARDWLAFGRLVLAGGTVHGTTVVAPDELAACFTGSVANARYGLTWWLSPLRAVPDVVYASGSGGQAMYVVPSERTIAVRFGASSSYKHDAFLKRLLDVA
jgi:CubicO group peptidase (beta-lactamase class C family)